MENRTSKKKQNMRNSEEGEVGEGDEKMRVTVRQLKESKSYLSCSS